MSNINITVYNSKATQEAAERAEVAAEKAEGLTIGSGRVPAVAPGVLPSGPSGKDRYMVVRAVGDWTHGGNLVGSNADGYETVFWWDGDAETWSKNGDSVRIKGDPGANGTNGATLSQIFNPAKVGGYAIDEIVRDAGFQEYVSLSTSNTALLTDETKWKPIGGNIKKNEAGGVPSYENFLKLLNLESISYQGVDSAIESEEVTPTAVETQKYIVANGTITTLAPSATPARTLVSYAVIAGDVIEYDLINRGSPPPMVFVGSDSVAYSLILSESSTESTNYKGNLVIEKNGTLYLNTMTPSTFSLKKIISAPTELPLTSETGKYISGTGVISSGAGTRVLISTPVVAGTTYFVVAYNDRYNGGIIFKGASGAIELPLKKPNGTIASKFYNASITPSENGTIYINTLGESGHKIFGYVGSIVTKNFSAFTKIEEFLTLKERVDEMDGGSAIGFDEKLIAIPDKFYVAKGVEKSLYLDNFIAQDVDNQGYKVFVNASYLNNNGYKRRYGTTNAENSVTLNIQVFDKNSSLVKSYSKQLISNEVPSVPARQFNIICIGDSLTQDNNMPKYWNNHFKNKITDASLQPLFFGLQGNDGTMHEGRGGTASTFWVGTSSPLYNTANSQIDFTNYIQTKASYYNSAGTLVTGGKAGATVDLLSILLGWNDIPKNSLATDAQITAITDNINTLITRARVSNSNVITVLHLNTFMAKEAGYSSSFGSYVLQFTLRNLVLLRQAIITRFQSDSKIVISDLGFCYSRDFAHSKVSRSVSPYYSSSFMQVDDSTHFTVEGTQEVAMGALGSMIAGLKLII